MGVATKHRIWFDADRSLAYLRVIAVLNVAAVVVLFATTRDGIDFMGRPIGTDFISFWTAAQLPADKIYSADALYAAQKALFPVQGYTAFIYPPVYALYCKAIGAIPYIPALIAFIGVTFAAYWWALAKWMKQHALVFALAFPAFFLTIGHGQTSFLAAALLGGGTYLLGSRPVLAGLLFGLLIFKPHIGLLIPVCLIAGRHWRALLSGGATILVLSAASTLVFGFSIWSDWLSAAPFGRQVMESGAVGFGKMPSVFAGARLLGLGIAEAYVCQVFAAGISVVTLAVISWRQPYSMYVGVVMITGTLLTTPFIHDYDLTLLAFVLAYLIGLADKHPIERFAIGLGFIFPLFARSIATAADFPIGPLAIAFIFAVVLRRVNPMPAERHVAADHEKYAAGIGAIHPSFSVLVPYAKRLVVVSH